MQPQKEDDLSKIFKFGPLRGRPEMFYEHIPQCQDDPNCFRSACGYCHPERDSRNTRWTWVYPSEKQQQQQPPYSPQYAQSSSSFNPFIPSSLHLPPPQSFSPSQSQSLYQKEIKSKTEVFSCNLNFLDSPPRPYNPWAFNSTELRKDFISSLAPIQRPITRFSSALKIESPRDIEKQGTQFFPGAKVEDKDKDNLTQEVEKQVEESIEKIVHDTVALVQDVQEKETVTEAQKIKEQETGRVPSIKLNETISTSAPVPVASNPDSNLATSSKAPATSTTASNNSSILEPKHNSSILEPKPAENNRKEIHLKSKSFQKEMLSLNSDTTKQLRIRKLGGHDQGRAQFSLKGGSSDIKLSKPSQSSHLEKARRVDAIKKESSSQLLDTDASPPIVQEQSWWEMFILFWLTCGKKARMLLVALCALFAVVFHRVVPKSTHSCNGPNRDNSICASKAVSSPSPSLPSPPSK